MATDTHRIDCGTPDRIPIRHDVAVGERQVALNRAVERFED